MKQTRVARFVPRFLGICAAFVFAGWVASTWQLEVLGQKLLQPALTLSSGGTLTAAELSDAVSVFQDSRGRLRCRADLLRAGGTLLLASAHSTPANTPDPERLQLAEDAFRESLACASHQGNVWLVLAQISTARQGFDDAAIGMLSTSYKLAPNEAWIMPRRVAFIANASGQVPDDLLSNMGKDVREILENPNWRTLVDIYSGSSQTGRLRLLAAVESSPDKLKTRFYLHVLRS
jgi:hypothetical protein